jgi:transposase
MLTTPAQRAALRGWFAAARWAYNLTVEGLRGGGGWTLPPNETACTAVMRHPDRKAKWGDAPPTVIKEGSRDAITAHCAGLAKHGPGRFALQFRSGRRDLTESIQLDAAQFAESNHGPRLKDTGPVTRILPVPEPTRPNGTRAHVWLRKSMLGLGPVVIRDRPWLIDRLVADRWLRSAARLLWDRRRGGEVYLLVRLRVTQPPAPADGPVRVVAMDPGVRRFQTLYDPDDGRYGELLAEYRTPGSPERSVAAELLRRCERVDRWMGRYQSWERRDGVRRRPPGRRARFWGRRGDTSPRQYRRYCHREAHQARRRDQRHARRELGRLAGFKESMHYGAIGFLWRHWDVVVVSTTSPGGALCERARRPFGSRTGFGGTESRGRTVRAACAWSHHAFRQRLQWSAFRRPGKHVLAVDEAYTTRTCGLCGTLNHNVAAAKVFRCVDPQCGVQIDRDVNGARNILLRELTRRWALPA